LARRFGAEVHLITAVEPPAAYRQLVSLVQSRVAPLDESLAAARARLAATGNVDALSGLHVTSHVAAGKPFEEIIKLARDIDADLLAVGTKSLHGAARLLLGSTAERVVRKAPLPVLVVKGELPDAPRAIVIPTDFSTCAQQAAIEGVALARRWGSRVVFVHVIEPITQAYVWPGEPGLLPLFPVEPAELDAEWNQLTSAIDLSGVSWERVAVKGRAGEAIPAAAVEVRAELVVIGTHGYSGLTHVLLGSVAEHVVRDAACSVLTIRPGASQFEIP
jgi:nucleotide-binding universal stress UspA family protein